MIHIVFNEADIDVMKKAIEMDESLKGDVVQIKDEYAVGPLQEIYTQQGMESRKNWWREILSGGDYAKLVDEGVVDDPKTVSELILRLRGNVDESIWVWVAPNKHDMSGYYWLISQLKNYNGRIFILHLNNLPFINEKGHIFYPEWLSMIPPREFIKAKKLARPVTLSEFEIDPDEWNRICAEGKGVRLLEGGKKLVQYDYDFYDEDLKKYITADWQKAGRIIHHFLHKNKHTTGDAYLLWRLKLIVASGDYDMQGELKGAKDFEVKAKSLQAAETENG
jgi:Domain of unknown function (DUF1835)/Protein of unknown function